MESPLCFEFGVKICPFRLTMFGTFPKGAGKNLRLKFLGSPLGELSSVSETKGGFSKLIYQPLSKATLVSSF